MSQRMTEDRFIRLADAYGADISRWPQAERADALALAEAKPGFAERWLAAERRLDAALTLPPVAEPRPALRARIIEAAPRQRAIGRALRWLAGAGLGVGLAASCAAGVAAGVVLAPEGVTQLIGGASVADNAGDVSSLADPAGDAANG